MSEHEHHEKPQPVLVPFILLWVAIFVIWFIGTSQKLALEGAAPNGVTLAGEGLAGARSGPVEVPTTASSGAPAATMTVPAPYATGH